MRDKRQFFAFCGFTMLILPQIWAFTSALSPNYQFSPFPESMCCPSFSNRGTQTKIRTRTQRILGAVTNNQESETAAPDASPATILESYKYDGWTLTYRTTTEDEAETKTNEDYHNVLLIHPVGIGLASWFWEPFLAALREKKSKSNPRIRAYAPNLIGCGISEGSDAWNPDQRGIFLPLGWVKGCEALVNQINDRNEGTKTKPQKWTVVTQGGLAPIGVLLAARNPELVETLVLTSPPTWKDMTNAVPPKELERNYSFLRSPLLGKLAFSILETRGLVEFFSNQFLFTQECDDTWLDKTEREMCAEARPPVQNFNAGMCMNRGLERELVEEIQTKIPNVLVVQGENDKRPRKEYEENMDNCELVTIKGTTNVVPWEDPEALADFLLESIVV